VYIRTIRGNKSLYLRVLTVFTVLQVIVGSQYCLGYNSILMLANFEYHRTLFITKYVLGSYYAYLFITIF